MHRCDPDPADAPLTTLRVRRALVAVLNVHKHTGRDQTALTDVVIDLGECPNCLRQALFQTIGITAGLIRQHEPEFLMALELQIAATEANGG